MAVGGRNRCQVCASKDRYRIEFGLARRISVKTLARRYGVDPSAVYRHRRRHVPEQVMIDLRHKADLPADELERLRIEESGGLLEHLVVQRAKLYQLADRCEEEGDYPHAIAAHTRITSNLELTGRLLDVFAAHRPIHQSIIVSADYLRLRQLLLAALKPFPEARGRILDVLRTTQVEAGKPDLLTGEVFPSARSGATQAEGASADQAASAQPEQIEHSEDATHDERSEGRAGG